MPGEQGMYRDWQRREREVAAQPPSWANQPTYDETDPDMGAPAPGPEWMESQSFEDFRGSRPQPQKGWGIGGSRGGKNSQSPIQYGQQAPTATESAQQGYSQGVPPSTAPENTDSELSLKMQNALSGALRGGL